MCRSKQAMPTPTIRTGLRVAFCASGVGSMNSGFYFCAKEINIDCAKSATPEAGGVWTWMAICADIKLVPSWRAGDRSSATAIDFIDDLQLCLVERMQLYLEAFEDASGADVGYASLRNVLARPWKWKSATGLLIALALVSAASKAVPIRHIFQPAMPSATT